MKLKTGIPPNPPDELAPGDAYLISENGDFIVTEAGARIIVTSKVEARTTEPLLLQAIVRVLAEVSDGHLIDSLEVPWRLVLDLLNKDPAARFQIEPRKLEDMIAAAYKDHGFDEVILTPRSGDGGRDVIATMKGRFEVRIIDSVKALGERKRVGHDDVRAVRASCSCTRTIGIRLAA